MRFVAGALVFLSVLVCQPRISKGEDVITGIIKTGSCSCEATYNNGPRHCSFSLALANWTHLVLPGTGSDANVTWYYSPCQAYQVPGDELRECSGVGVCKQDGNKFYNYGTIDSVHWGVTTEVEDSRTQSLPVILYQGTEGRSSAVTLDCNNFGGSFIQTSEINNSAAFTLSSEDACSYLCTTEESSGSSLSGGSVVLIIFFSLVFVYFVGGMIFLRVSRGAKGTELIPHYQFWSSLPGLIKEGGVFLVNGCKPLPDQTYEKI